MRFGIGIATCREGWDLPPGFCGPQDIINVVQKAERLSIDFVWASDFISLTPNHQKRLPRVPNWYEVLISLAACSSVTKRIGLGIGVMIMPFRDPIILAKQLATLDNFSNGRVILGVGQGALKEEFERIMPRWKKFHRGRMLEEQLEALKLLFSQDQATFKGKYYEFEGVTLYPRPVQSPFPMYISGHSEDTPRRVIKWGKGRVVPSSTIDGFKEEVQKLRVLAEREGRDFSTVDIMISGGLSLAKTHDEAVKRYPERQAGKRLLASPGATLEKLLPRHFVGTPTEVAERISRLKEAGLTHCIAQNIAADNLGEMEEQIHMFAEEVIPLVKKG